MRCNVMKVRSTVLNVSEILNLSHRTLCSFTHVYGRFQSLVAPVNEMDVGAYRNTEGEPLGMYMEVSC
jgi:hypothetical protein